jgi:shikimate kinase
VGERCAALLDRPFVDTDELVESTAHATVAEIFERHGEAHFRELERQVVVDLTASPAPLVIACGGGAVIDPGSRRLLRDAGVVVWLQAPTEELSVRVGDGASRPLLRAGGAAPTLDRLAAERGALYEAVAHAAVETAGRSVEQVADAVLAAARECDRWSG